MKLLQGVRAAFRLPLPIRVTYKRPAAAVPGEAESTFQRA
jgi:hypothetical protein